jgi:hypothetical protein
MIDLELKRKRIETLAKIGALVVTCLVLGPFYLTLLHGLGALFALFIAFGIGFVAINFMPWFAAMVANWRLKALKYEASVNPIETLENQEADKMKALAARREEIKELLVVVQDLWGQIQEHDAQYPGKPSQNLERYNKLRALVANRGEKFKQAKQSLAEFHDFIEEKRSDWRIAQTFAKAQKLANAGEDFQTNLMKDTASIAIQDGLNRVFAELDASALDEQPVAQAPTQVTTLPASKPRVAIADNAPPTLDLEIGAVEAEPVPAPRSRSRY